MRKAILVGLGAGILGVLLTLLLSHMVQTDQKVQALWDLELRRQAQAQTQKP